MKKIFILLFSLLLFWSFLGCDLDGKLDNDTNQDDTIVDDGDDSGGDDTIEMINSIEDLVNMKNNLDGDYILGRDLDFDDPGCYESGIVDTTLISGEGFTPIGAYSGFGENNKFTGIFDGDGYTIRNLYINRPDAYNVGLFGVASVTARIVKVCLENIEVTGKGWVGGLIGDVNDSYEGSSEGFVLENCSVSGTIIGEDNNIGGILGHIRSDSNDIAISNCLFFGTVQGDSSIGGLFGSIDGDDANAMTIHNCEAESGTVVDGDGIAGGVAGEIESFGTMTHCLSSADVFGSRCGGLVGTIDGSNGNSLLSDCIATGNVTLDNASYGTEVGGLVGWIRSCSIENCHATGNVTVETYGTYCGGLIGYGTISAGMDEFDFSIRECSATGDITFSSPNAGSAGGFSGRIYTQIGDCYSKGDIAVLAGTHELGGFAYTINHDISNCFTTGNIIGNNVSQAGGFAASHASSTPVVSSCIAFGDTITFTGSYSNPNIDRFIGNNLLSISGAYVNSAMIITVGSSAGFSNGLSGTDLTIGQFLDASSAVYGTWDFTAIWEMGAEGPILRRRTVLFSEMVL